MMQSMHQLHQQLKQLEHQARSQALAALSPSHRAILINLLGQQAIAEKSDRKALAAKLDATLSASEKTAILNIATSTHSKARALMQGAHKHMISQLPADVQQRIAQHMAQMEQGAKHKKHTPDAGRALLALVTHHARGGMMEQGGFGRGGHPGMGPGHGPGGPGGSAGAWGPHRGGPPPPPPAPTPGTN
jgi:hypothetical protein